MTANAVVYPSAISRACAAIDEAATFKTMPDTFYRVVLRIIKKINVSRPNSPILASRGKLAQESGKSIETVGRTIKWLEDRGLILRAQKARAGLRGSSSPLVPTGALIETLLLDKPVAAKPKPPQSPRVSDGSKPTQPKASPNGQVIIDGKAIAADLAWLVTDQGLLPSGLFKLMSMASRFGQRLSNIVAANAKYLQSKKNRELFAYLVKIIGKNEKDYNFIAREKEVALQDEQKKMRLEQKKIELRGRAYQSRDKKTYITVEATGCLLVSTPSASLRPQYMDYEFLDAIEDGRLVQVREEEF